MIPERQLATVIHQRYELSPPIDVEALARSFADVERDELPIEGDAIVVGVDNPAVRPKIILARGRHINRERFTLAHEIGHIVLPWHIGTIACDMGYHEAASDIYLATEAEANKFASELLMPSSWISRVVERENHFPAILREIRTAKVSDEAALLAIAQVAPPGLVCILKNRHEEPVRVVKSTDTRIHLPANTQPIDEAELSRMAPDSGVVESGLNKIHWWQFSVGPAKLSSSDQRTDKEILWGIMNSSGISREEAMPDYLSIMAISGAAFGDHGHSSPEELLSVLQQRFVGRSKLAAFVSHEDFDAFLVKRSIELYSRRADPGT